MNDRERANAADLTVRCDCGLTFTRQGWLELEIAGTLKSDGELIELRRCTCARLIASSRSPDSTRS